ASLDASRRASSTGPAGVGELPSAVPLPAVPLPAVSLSAVPLSAVSLKATWRSAVPVPAGPASGSAEAPGRSAGLADTAQPFARFGQGVPGVGPEHLLQRAARAERVLQLLRAAQRAHPAAVHQGDPVAVLL